MLEKISILTLLFFLLGLSAHGQEKILTTSVGISYSINPDTSKFYANGKQITFFKGHSFNSWLIITDSLTNDTLEYDKQLSQNHSLSILYENNMPKYKCYCKAYFNKDARKTIRAKRHHDLMHVLRKLRIVHFTCFFPVFYYSKSARINGRKVLVNNKWKNYTNKNLKPTYALFDSEMIGVDREIRTKF